MSGALNLRALLAACVVVCTSAIVSCSDFDAAYQQCVAEGRCGDTQQDSGTVHDAGTEDAGESSDAGVDAGMDAGVDAGTDAGADGGGGNTCDASLCEGTVYTFDQRNFAVWGFDNSDVWVSGNAGTTHHWDGQEWTPRPLFSFSSQSATSLWGAAPNDVWVVGAMGEVARWNGSNWTEVAPPATASTVSLHDVHGASASDVWVVGDDGLILSFDGGTWHTHSQGSLLYNLSGVWVSGDGSGWAVGGSDSVWARDGGTWQLTSVNPSSSFNDVWGFAPNDAFMVDQFGYVRRWDGSGWTAVHQIAGISLLALHGTGPNDVFAVGQQAKIAWYDGTGWKNLASGLDAGFHFNGVWASPDEVWVSGFTFGTPAGFVVRYPRRPSP